MTDTFAASTPLTRTEHGSIPLPSKVVNTTKEVQIPVNFERANGVTPTADDIDQQSPHQCVAYITGIFHQPSKICTTQQHGSANTASAFTAPIAYYTMRSIITDAPSDRISAVVDVRVYTPKEPHVVIDA